MSEDAFRSANQSASDESARFEASVSGQSIDEASAVEGAVGGALADAESSPDRSIYRTSYDPSTDGSLDSAVIVAISEATGTPPTEIDPLYETVDPDALANLFAPKLGGDNRSAGTVSFVHHGSRVTVDGVQIVVEPRSVR